MSTKKTKNNCVVLVGTEEVFTGTVEAATAKVNELRAANKPLILLRNDETKTAQQWERKRYQKNYRTHSIPYEVPTPVVPTTEEPVSTETE